MQQQGLLEYNCASFRKAHLPPLSPCRCPEPIAAASRASTPPSSLRRSENSSGCPTSPSDAATSGLGWTARQVAGAGRSWSSREPRTTTSPFGLAARAVLRIPTHATATACTALIRTVEVSSFLLFNRDKKGDSADRGVCHRRVSCVAGLALGTCGGGARIALGLSGWRGGGGGRHIRTGQRGRQLGLGLGLHRGSTDSCRPGGDRGCYRSVHSGTTRRSPRLLRLLLRRRRCLLRWRLRLLRRRQ